MGGRAAEEIILADITTGAARISSYVSMSRGVWSAIWNESAGQRCAEKDADGQ